jgi:hypothetical protein
LVERVTHAPSAEQATKPASVDEALGLVIPRQHGAWSILLVGYAIGTLAFDGGGPAVPWLVLGAVTAGFVARHATLTALQLCRKDPRWRAVSAGGLALAGLSAMLMGVLVVGYGRWGLVIVAAGAGLLVLASVVIERRHRDRTAWGELVGVAGLSSAIPLASYARTGALDGPLLGLWLLGLLYFSGSVFHVRFIVRRWRLRRGPFVERLRAGLPSVVYHLAALGAVVALGTLGWTPKWVAVALVPVTAKALWALRRGGDTPPAIRSLGFTELGHSILFAVLAVVAYRVGVNGS